MLKSSQQLHGAPPLLWKQRVANNTIRAVLAGATTISLFTTIGVVIILLLQSRLFFSSSGVTIREFFLSIEWQPTIERFGILPLLNSTLITSLIALLFAAPLGLSVAIYLSEFASVKVRGIIKPMLETLAGIPTVVYGYFAINFITPLLRNVLGRDVVDFYNTASAGITIGILIIPLISSVSEDALSAVPRSLKQAALALGANKIQSAIRVVVPAAISGITASCILALSRAIGETMIVALAAGAGPNLTFNPLKAAETITGYIVRISGGDVGYDTPDYNSIFALALVLFIATFILNIISRKITNRFREVYE